MSACKSLVLWIFISYFCWNSLIDFFSHDFVDTTPQPPRFAHSLFSFLWFENWQNILGDEDKRWVMGNRRLIRILCDYHSWKKSSHHKCFAPVVISFAAGGHENGNFPHNLRSRRYDFYFILRYKNFFFLEKKKNTSPPFLPSHGPSPNDPIYLWIYYTTPIALSTSTTNERSYVESLVIEEEEKEEAKTKQNKKKRNHFEILKLFCLKRKTRVEKSKRRWISRFFRLLLFLVFLFSCRFFIWIFFFFFFKLFVNVTKEKSVLFFSVEIIFVLSLSFSLSSCWSCRDAISRYYTHEKETKKKNCGCCFCLLFFAF